MNRTGVYTRANAEIHMGAVYWVVGTNSFDTTGKFTLTSQGYVGAAFDPNTIGTCGGTRNGRANWGTSVNFVTP